MLPTCHPQLAMLEILPQSKVWDNPNIGFKEMHEHGDLENRIGVQVS
jgi:hypothetical protein